MIIIIIIIIIIIPSRYRYENRSRETPASCKRPLSGATVLNLPLPSIVLAAKIKFLIYPIHNLAGGINCITLMIMGLKSIVPRELLRVCSLSPALDVWELDSQRKVSDSFPWRLVEQVAPSHVGYHKTLLRVHTTTRDPTSRNYFPSRAWDYENWETTPAHTVE